MLLRRKVILVNKELFGITPDNENVFLYTIANSNSYKMSVMNFGCALVSFSMPNREGFVNEITLGYNELDDYLVNNPYFGVIIGRYANRISEGRFSIGENDYTLALNDNNLNHLHGGMRGFNKAVWDSEIIHDHFHAGVLFSYKSEDGEEGYPGNLDVTVKYILNDKNELIFEYNAQTDKTTPVNLCNHAYWNLSGPESGTVFEHELKLNCDKYLPVGNDFIPTGDIKDVAGTAFDFTKRKKIGKDFKRTSGGYDHCFVINNFIDNNIENTKLVDLKKNDSFDFDDTETNDRYKDINFAASVYEPVSGRLMEVYTTKPGIQFYSGNFLDNEKGRYGILYDRHGGFALETEFFPDSVNIKKFPSPFLHPGEEYHHITMHRFSIL